MLVILFFIGFTQVVAAASINEGQWTYKKSHTIVGSTAGALTNYQMRFIVHYGSGNDSGEDVYCNSQCKTDFGDIRFSDTNGELLDYWIESKVEGNEAIFWVKIDYIPESPDTTTIWIYMGKSGAQSESNGENTFMFFDDFSGSSLDTSKWTDISQSSGQVGIDNSNHWLELTSPGSRTSHTVIESIPISTGPMVVESRRKVVSADWDRTNYAGTAICDEYYVPGDFAAYPDSGIIGYHTAYEDQGVTLKEFISRNNIDEDFYAYSFSADTFVRTKLTLTSTTAKYSIEGHEASNSLATDFTTNNNRIAIVTNAWGSATATCYEKIDWVFVRKYVDPEPSHAISNESPRSGSKLNIFTSITPEYLFGGIAAVIVVVSLLIVLKTDLLSNLRTRQRSERPIRRDIKKEAKREAVEIAEAREEIRCAFCAHIITANIKYCPGCGTEIPQCIVCLLPIVQGDDFAKCPYCGSFAHKNHLVEWVKVKGSCPYCKERLTEFDIPS